MTLTSNPFGTTNGPIPGHNSFSVDPDFDASIEELDNIRLREVTGKAVSGTLLFLLKWFKRSRKSTGRLNQVTSITFHISNYMFLDILKFEYMTQLLLDSNYLPLILKMFAHQDIDQAIAHKTDREEMG